jgi:hypothetical protein
MHEARGNAEIRRRPLEHREYLPMAYIPGETIESMRELIGRGSALVYPPVTGAWSVDIDTHPENPLRISVRTQKSVAP